MNRRTFKKKHNTVHSFGSRKRKSPMHKKRKKTPPAASECELFVGSERGTDDIDAVPSILGAVRSAEEMPSESTGHTGQVHFEPQFVPTNECRERGPGDIDALPSTSGTVQSDEEMPSSSTARTVQVHLEPQFVSTNECRERAASVQASLSSMSATERKMKLLGDEGENSTAAEDTDEFLVIQVAAINALLSKALCQQCLQPGLTVVPGTRHGLAVRMFLTCATCGAVANEWTSPRQEGSKIFDVNLRSMQAVKSIGKGATALNDFWSVMNVSHRGLDQKTFQKHLKRVFRPAGDAAAANVFSDAVTAVRDVYTEMEVSFTKNVTVVYDGTWMTRGHTSHIGVGTVIEFYTGLVLDAVVLSNRCHGCALGPKQGDPGYDDWEKSHVCQKNTDAPSGRMEVEAALVLFRRSLAKNDLRYTNIVCDGDCRTYLTLCEDRTYGFIPLTKEDCINHVKKRMDSGLRGAITKGKKGQPLGGRGGLTQGLIKKLTNYYGMALRAHPDVEGMQKAVMATFYHVTSTDTEPHHELCPPGPTSWCKHRVAEAKGEPQPPHKYNLARHVAEALLPLYRRLSEPQLLERCRGKKTQNAAESLHSVIWSILPKDENASLIAAETAVNEAVLKYNAGTLRAYTELCTSLGVKPGQHALQRAEEKDIIRKKKATKALQTQGQMAKRRHIQKDTKSYSPGAF
ncbi:uncharacterized protein LOC144172264 [Haemaphysalis longicornis]